MYMVISAIILYLPCAVPIITLYTYVMYIAKLEMYKLISTVDILKSYNCEMKGSLLYVVHCTYRISGNIGELKI